MRFAGLVVLLLAGCAPQTRAPDKAAAPPAIEGSSQPVGSTLAGDEVPAPAGEITLTSPVSGARVTSPLIVEGAVINTWMFEGMIPVELAIGGEVVAQAPGRQQAPDSWTNPGPVRFRAVLTFDVAKDTDAVLILREDAPRPVDPDSDVGGPARTLRIPLVLAPGPAGVSKG